MRADVLADDAQSHHKRGHEEVKDGEEGEQPLASGPTIRRADEEKTDEEQAQTGDNDAEDSEDLSGTTRKAGHQIEV